MVKICKKYHRNGVFTVRYALKKGKMAERCFYSDGFKRKNPLEDGYLDKLPNNMPDTGGTSLIDRLKAEKCEVCGAAGELVMHHVRKLKDLPGKDKWELHMIARRRKTIALCHSCHRLRHHGKV